MQHDLVKRYLDGALTIDEFIEGLTGYSPIVGYLKPHNKGHVVFCPECFAHDTGGAASQVERWTPVYRENIYPYKQHCYGCGKRIVEGQSAIWPNLFDGKL